MFPILLVVLLITTFFISSSSKERCEVNSLSEYLTRDYLQQHKCDEVRIMNGTEILVPSKLREAGLFPLKVLNIHGGISEITKNSFRYRSNTWKSITINDNTLSTLPDDAFAKLTLEKLDLRFNKIVFPGLKPFSNSVIEELDLSNNKITTLLKSTFSLNIVNLKIIDNRISYVEPECFPSTLQTLDLSYNLLYSIGKKHFKNLENLEKLDLSYNRLVSIDFTDNNLDQLGELDLSFNLITTLNHTKFAALKSLYLLNLSGNHLKSISPQFLQNFGKLKKFDISFNYFTNFPYKSLPGSINILDAFENPWNCNCYFAMEKYLIFNHVTFNCNSKTDVVCITHGNTCEDIANETLIAEFIENIDKTFTRPCERLNDRLIPAMSFEEIFPPARKVDPF